MSIRADAPTSLVARREAPFFVYVEGPRDRDVLRAWARRHSPRLAKALAPACRILGGRQPARALDDLRARREHDPQARGLCILDRDGEGPPEAPPPDCGLELYTWRRRHIESYLLVPEAIERALGRGDGRLLRFVRDELGTHCPVAFDAKRFLGPKGPVARWLGRPFPPGRIARALRREELDPEVGELFERVAERLGVFEAPVAVHRRAGNRWPGGLS